MGALTPRITWLRNRIKECVKNLGELEENQNWSDYKHLSKLYAEEILYAVTEWEKYYERQP